MYAKLALNSQSSCLCLPSAWIRHIPHSAKPSLLSIFILFCSVENRHTYPQFKKMYMAWKRAKFNQSMCYKLGDRKQTRLGEAFRGCTLLFMHFKILSEELLSQGKWGERSLCELLAPTDHLQQEWHWSKNPWILPLLGCSLVLESFVLVWFSTQDYMMQRGKVKAAALICFSCWHFNEPPEFFVKQPMQLRTLEVQGHSADIGWLSRGLWTQGIMTGSSAG